MIYIQLLTSILGKYITIKKKTDLDDSCLTEISRRHPVSLALIHCHGDQVTAKGLRDMFRECADSLKVWLRSVGTLAGEATLLFSFCIPSQWWSTLRGKNPEQIFSFKSIPLFKSFLFSGEQVESLKNCFPFRNWQKTWRYTHTFWCMKSP